MIVPHPMLGRAAVLMLVSALAGQRLQAGEAAPEVVLSRLDGKEFRYGPPSGEPTKPGKGSVEVFVFIDPGQRQSRACLDDLVALAESLGDLAARTGLVAIASGGLEKGQADALGRRHPAGGPVLPLLDPERKAYASFGVIALPTTFVVDGSGIIRRVLAGRSAAYRKRLAAAIRSAHGQDEAENEPDRPADPVARKVARRRRLARDLASKGYLPQAADQLEAACALRPDDPGLLVDLGEIRLDLEDGEAALAAFSKALAAAPDSRAARAGRAKAMALGDDLDVAEAALRKELEKPGSDPALHYFLGRVLERRGDAAGAAAAYRRAYEKARRR